MRPDDFSQAVISLMGNTLLPEDGKGVMVALRPVPGLRAEQAMTLCFLRRFGDVMTVVQGRLVLFLSTCRINDLDTALKFIFRLPVDEAFSNRVVWHQDVDIISELNGWRTTPIFRCLQRPYRPHRARPPPRQTARRSAVNRWLSR
jgi:hypothetical protein